MHSSCFAARLVHFVSTPAMHPIANGMAQGSFQIPKRTKKGDYIFRAYTRWMQNYGPEQFAVQSVRIGNPETEANPLTDAT